MIIWTQMYNPLLLGGSCHYIGGCEVDVGEKLDLGKDFYGYKIISPKGKVIIVEGTSGAIVGNSLEEVRKDITMGTKTAMKKQVEEACEAVKNVKLMAVDKFWEVYKG